MNLYETLTAAIRDLETNGYDSTERVARWSEEIRLAAEREMLPPATMAKRLRDLLGAKYDTFLRSGLYKAHPGIARYTVERLKPAMRRELDRRIVSSADLIRLNRQEAIEKTLRRFAGWATSIPAGGTDAVDTIETKTELRKALKQLPFVERRVLIDQGHKMIAAVNQVVAEGGGALAMVWHSRWRVAGYDYREDHKERDRQVYAIRGNWALQKGLMRKGPAGYADEITKPAEEVFCQCSGQWLYSLRALPRDMLTDKGIEELARVRKQLATGGN